MKVMFWFFTSDFVLEYPIVLIGRATTKHCQQKDDKIDAATSSDHTGEEEEREYVVDSCII